VFIRFCFDYWKEMLENIPQQIDMITDYPRPLTKKFLGSRRYFVLDKEIYEGLDELRKLNTMTFYMVILALFQILFNKYSENTDFAVFTPMVNRDNKVTQMLMGLFDNLIISRADLKGNPSIIDFFKRVKMFSLEAFEHQLPFEVLANEIPRIPKFQVQLSMLESSMRTLELSGLNIERYEFDIKTAMCDFEIYFWERNKEINGYIQYSTEIYKPETIDCMIDDLLSIVRQITQEPHRNINDIEISYCRETHLQNIRNNTYEKLDTDVKQAIKRICCETLGVNEIKMDKTFYELGGHSLTFFQFLNSLEKKFKIKINKYDYFKSTIREITKEISSTYKSHSQNIQ